MKAWICFSLLDAFLLPCPRQSLMAISLTWAWQLHSWKGSYHRCEFNSICDSSSYVETCRMTLAAQKGSRTRHHSPKCSQGERRLLLSSNQAFKTGLRNDSNTANLDASSFSIDTIIMMFLRWTTAGRNANWGPTIDVLLWTSPTTVAHWQSTIIFASVESNYGQTGMHGIILIC